MTELTKERLIFIEMAHQYFLIKKGFGAYAFISVKELMRLFDEYKGSQQSADQVLAQYVKSFYD